VAVGQMLNELIDHIDVYETQGTGKNKTQRLVIYYKFVGYLDIDPTQCHPNYTADIREGVAIEYVSCEPPENLKELFSEGYNADDDSFEEEETELAGFLSTKTGAGVNLLRTQDSFVITIPAETFIDSFSIKRTGMLVRIIVGVFLFKIYFQHLIPMAVSF